MTQSIVNRLRYLLVIQQGQTSPGKHRLESGRSHFIGSSSQCGIRLDEEQDVADVHALLSLDDEEASIQDWASPTGTFVNGSRIDSKVVIGEQDQVKLGSVTFTIRALEESAVEVRQPQPSADATAGLDIDEQESAASHRELESVAEHELIDEYESIDEHNGNISEQPLADEHVVAAEESPWHADVDEPSQDDHWKIAPAGDSQYDQETVDLLKAEIDDLRSLLADRDLQIEELSLPGAVESDEVTETGQQTEALQQRIEHLLAEANEHDERFAIVHDLLESAELKNQAEVDERQTFEAWVGEIEHRIGQREAEWQAQLAAARERLQATEQERDQLQHQLRDVASRFGAKDAYRDTLEKLQTQNSELQDDLEGARQQITQLEQQLHNLRDRDAETIQQERATIAKERADVSRMRFELSQRLSEFEQLPEPNNSVDREVALRMRTLRSHLREIHAQEQEEREQQGGSLFGRLSGLWKRVDDEY